MKTRTRPIHKPSNGSPEAISGAKTGMQETQANGQPQPSQALLALQQIAQALPTCCVPVAQHQQLRQCVEIVARELDRLEKLVEAKT